jgi:phosphate transport system substrate-binding protein
MRNKLITFISILLIAACGGSSTCESEKESAPGLTGKVRIDGSSTVFPISEAVAEEFNAVAPGVRVTVGVSGTGGGFKKFVNKETDINDASRSIKPSEIERAQEAGIRYI